MRQGSGGDMQGNIDNLGKNEYEKEAIDYFLSLKQSYKEQRQIWERRWEQARAAVFLNDNLDKIYNGRSNIKSPVMLIKARGIWSRINKILFNSEPFGRLEETQIDKKNGDIIDLHNDYIFNYQLDKIGYKEAQKMLVKDKTILGTSVGKVTYELEDKELAFSDDDEPINVTVKDDTYLRPILLEEFYSDVNKFDIDESQACIHHTTISLDELYANERKRVTVEYDILDNQTGEPIGVEEKTEIQGVYKNLNLLIGDSDNITEEQELYAQYMGWSQKATNSYRKCLKEIKKNGYVEIDECYGLFDLKGNGELQECICVIAEGRVCIRLEPTPFKHRRYVRPFIIGRYQSINGCLYGISNVVLGENLLQEYNACRAQATDAKTRSVSHMWYKDKTKMIEWDGVWRPDGVITGDGPSGMVPIINPNLSNVPLSDSITIQQDIDRLWSLSPVQEGTSNASQIPGTKGATLAIIQQNDLPINDIIEDTIEFEVKKFIEMLLERNITFKELEEYTKVWDEEKIQKTGVQSMKDLFIDFNVSILGTMELANELTHQQGYIQFGQLAQQIPQLNMRIDWVEYGEKVLRAYGIKDDASGELWLPEEEVQKAQQAQQEAQMKQLEMQEQQRQKMRQEEIEDYRAKKEIDTESDMVEKTHEVSLEAMTGEKVA